MPNGVPGEQERGHESDKDQQAPAGAQARSAHEDPAQHRWRLAGNLDVGWIRRAVVGIQIFGFRIQ